MSHWICRLKRFWKILIYLLRKQIIKILLCKRKPQRISNHPLTRQRKNQDQKIKRYSFQKLSHFIISLIYGSLNALNESSWPQHETQNVCLSFLRTQRRIIRWIQIKRKKIIICRRTCKKIINLTLTR